MRLQDKYARARAKLDPTYALPPRVIYLTVTERCNANCVMCDAPKGKEDMPLEQYKKLVDKVSKWSPIIHINAMEPLLHPYIEEMVHYAKSKGVRVVLTTNGLLLEHHALGLQPLELLWASIDGVGELHDSIRRVPGAYDKAVRGIESALRVGIPTGVSYCINEYNYGNLVETAEAMKELGVQRMVFNHLNYYDWKPKDVDTSTLMLQLQEVGRGFSKFATCLPDLEWSAYVQAWYHQPQKAVPVGSGTCGAMKHGSQIVPSGDAHVAFRCFAPVMGNVFKDGILKVWNSKPYREFRQSMNVVGAAPDCYRCCSLYGN